MYRFYVLCCAFVLAGSFVSLAQKEKLDRLMDYYAAHDHFNGTALVVRHGAIIMSKSYGYRDVENKLKNTENTIYQIGTNTSQFTAEVMVQLDSKGKLGLEDRLSKYLPDYPYGDRITLKHLLTHTSGIYDYVNDPYFTDAAHPMKREEVVERFRNQPLAFAPGSGFAYSNSDYYLLGMVIEKITMKKYEREVKEDIIFNCGMSRSGFNFQGLRDDQKAIGYYSDSGKMVAAPLTDSTISYAAGAMYSTAGDLLKWHRALLHHKLLPKDWQDLAYSPFKNDYALGWNITRLYNRKFMEHAGVISGFSSYVVRQEEDDVLIVLLENVNRTGESEVAIAGNIIQCLYEKNYVLPADRKKPAVARETTKAPSSTTNEVSEGNEPVVSAAQLRKYVGEYEITPAFTLSFTLHGNELYASSPDQKAIKMVPENETLFRAAGWNAEIEFLKSNTGAVNRIVLHQQGELIPGVRSR